jgi:hypothetical protein
MLVQGKIFGYLIKLHRNQGRRVVLGTVHNTGLQSPSWC